MSDYKQIDYSGVCRRIKECRRSLRYTVTDGKIAITDKGKVLSQVKLLEYMRQENLYTFSRTVLSNIENGRTEYFEYLQLKKLESLCSVFNCSIGYLLKGNENMVKVKVRRYTESGNVGDYKGAFVSYVYHVDNVGDMLVYDPDNDIWMWVNPMDTMPSMEQRGVPMGERKRVSIVKPVEAW